MKNFIVKIAERGTAKRSLSVIAKTSIDALRAGLAKRLQRGIRMAQEQGELRCPSMNISMSDIIAETCHADIAMRWFSNATYFFNTTGR